VQESTSADPMLRIRGDRTSLITALVSHWLDQTLQLPTGQQARPGLTGKDRTTREASSKPKGQQSAAD
jgi:hypothetical protein